MCSCSGRVAWCSWIRCLPRRGIRCQRANSFTCKIFVMYFLWNCKVFVQHLQSIWEMFVKYFQQPCTIGSVGSGGAQEGDPVSHRPFNNCSCSSFRQKLSRVFNILVMHFNVFAYHLYGICKVFAEWSEAVRYLEPCLLRAQPFSPPRSVNKLWRCSSLYSSFCEIKKE